MSLLSIKIESSKGTHIPSQWACATLNVSNDPVPALAILQMLDGSPYSMHLGWGVRDIVVSGSGKVSPHLGQVPLAETVLLHSSDRDDTDDLEDLAYQETSTVMGRPILSGRRFITVSIADIEAIVGQVRKELNRQPVISCMYTRETPLGNELAVFDGENYRSGDTIYVEVPESFESLRASFYPVYSCVLSKPLKRSTDRATGVISWSMEFKQTIQLAVGAA